LDKALQDGKVRVEITGLGGSTGDTILLNVQRQVPETLRLSLTPGTVFKSATSTVQNMVGAAIKGERVSNTSYRPSSQIVLTDDAKHAYVIQAYCLDFDKGNPGHNDSFSVSPVDVRAAEILAAGQEMGASINVIQSGLWIDREGVGERELKRRFPVTDADITAARGLLGRVEPDSERKAACSEGAESERIDALALAESAQGEQEKGSPGRAPGLPKTMALILDVRFHDPTDAGGQISVGALRRILDALAPLQGSVFSYPSGAFQRDPQSAIQISRDYFSRELTRLKLSGKKHASEVTKIYESILREGKLSKRENSATLAGLDWGSTTSWMGQTHHFTWEETYGELAAIFARKNVTLEAQTETGLPRLEVEFTEVSQEGYRISGGRFSDLSATAFGLDATIVLRRGDEILYREALGCEWPDKLGYVFTPADNMKELVAKRMGEIVNENLGEK